MSWAKAVCSSAQAEPLATQHEALPPSVLAVIWTQESGGIVPTLHGIPPDFSGPSCRRRRCRKNERQVSCLPFPSKCVCEACVSHTRAQHLSDGDVRDHIFCGPGCKTPCCEPVAARNACEELSLLRTTFGETATRFSCSGVISAKATGPIPGTGNCLHLILVVLRP